MKTQRALRLRELSPSTCSSSEEAASDRGQDSERKKKLDKAVGKRGMTYCSCEGPNFDQNEGSLTSQKSANAVTWGRLRPPSGQCANVRSIKYRCHMIWTVTGVSRRLESASWKCPGPATQMSQPNGKCPHPLRHLHRRISQRRCNLGLCPGDDVYMTSDKIGSRVGFIIHRKLCLVSERLLESHILLSCAWFTVHLYNNTRWHFYCIQAQKFINYVLYQSFNKYE